MSEFCSPQCVLVITYAVLSNRFYVISVHGFSFISLEMESGDIFCLSHDSGIEKQI